MPAGSTARAHAKACHLQECTELAYSKKAVDNGASIWCRQSGIGQNYGIDRIQDAFTPADFHNHASVSGRCGVVSCSFVDFLAVACIVCCIAVHTVVISLSLRHKETAYVSSLILARHHGTAMALSGSLVGLFPGGLIVFSSTAGMSCFKLHVASSTIPS